MHNLTEIRAKLTDDQRASLNSIWHYHFERDKWMPVAALYRRFGKETTLAAFSSLSASIVAEHPGHGERRFVLTFLGELLTEKGEEAERLLERLLGYMREKLRTDPEFNEVDSEEVRATLGLTDDESRLLSRTYWCSRLSGGGGSRGEDRWSGGIAYYIRNELPIEENLLGYLRYYALKEYDPELPVLYDERNSYLSAKNVSAQRSDFWFIDDADLRDLLDNDWREALRVHDVGAWKSCLLLCGSILEGVLIDALSQDKQNANAVYQRLKRRSASALEGWNLADLMDVADELKLFPRGTIHLGHAVREFRNLVHPGKQLRDNIKATEEQADVALNLVRMCLKK